MFLEQINKKIKKFDEESTKHKSLHRLFRYMLFFLSAITTICSGLALSYKEIQTEFNIVILVIGALIAIVAALEGLRRPFDLWILERNVYHSLKDLEAEFHFMSAGDEIVDVDKYHNTMQEILSSSKNKWVKKLKLESKPTKEKTKNN